MRRCGSVVVLLVAVLGTACGGGGDGDETEAAGGRAGPIASLAIITTEIDAALDGGPFRTAEEGEPLAAGDRLRTDDTGFAEVHYHEGSWQRVEAEATLTIVELADGAVRTAVDGGRSWNDVRELVEADDEYEIETPVATAAVRGTVFATDCTADDACSFTVLEGTVEVTPERGDPISVGAGERLVVATGTPPAPPSAVDPAELEADPWVARNRALEPRRPGDESAGDGEGGGAAGVPDACDLLTTDEARRVADSNDERYRVRSLAKGPEPIQASELRAGSDGTPIPGFSHCSWIFDSYLETDATDPAYRDVGVQVSAFRLDGTSPTACVPPPSASGGPAVPLSGIGDRAFVQPGGSSAAVTVGDLCLELHRTLVEQSGAFDRAVYEATLRRMVDRAGDGSTGPASP